MDKDDQLILEAYHKSLVKEGNVLQQRFNKFLSNGISVGMISPEAGEYLVKELKVGKTGDPDTDNAIDKKNAKKVIPKDLESARSQGLIGGWSGPNVGVYQPDPEADVYPEDSYIVHAVDSSEEKTELMIETLKEIGTKYNQESIMYVYPNGESYWFYLKDSWDGKHKQGEIVSKGKLHYDVPLHARGDIQGRTELVKGRPSEHGNFPKSSRSATAYKGGLKDEI